MAVSSLHRVSSCLFSRREDLGSSLGKAFTVDTQLKSVGGSSESSQKDHSSDKNGSKPFVKSIKILSQMILDRSKILHELSLHLIKHVKKVQMKGSLYQPMYTTKDPLCIRKYGFREEKSLNKLYFNNTLNKNM